MIRAMPSPEQITALAALVAAVGAIVTAVLQYLQRKPVAETHAAAAEVVRVTATGNGSTIGQNSAQAAEATKAIAADAGVPVPEVPDASTKPSVDAPPT